MSLLTATDINYRIAKLKDLVHAQAARTPEDAVIQEVADIALDMLGSLLKDIKAIADAANR